MSVENKKNDVCIMFDTYKVSDYIYDLFERYKDAAIGVCDISMVLHSSRVPDRGADDITLVTDEFIFDSYPCKKAENRKIIPGNCDLKTIASIEQLPGYRNYISIEFDVICTVDLPAALHELVEIARQCDLAGSYLADEASSASWMWWKSISPPTGIDLDRSTLRKAFLPLSMYSSRFAKIYREALSSGWQGHQEVLMPSIASIHNLDIFDISSGDRNITKFPQFNINEPKMLEKEIVPKFIHPVKNRDSYEKLPGFCQKML